MERLTRSLELHLADGKDKRIIEAYHAGLDRTRKEVAVIAALGADPFDIADQIIEEAYPNYYNRKKGWWGAQRIPNFGILRGAIASAIQRERSL